MKKAVYAGSFDPLTKGHLWMIEEGVRLFDSLVVAIGTNPDKAYTFSVEERLDMLHQVIPESDNLEVDHFHNKYLVDYAEDIGARYILRGIRSSSDYEYEKVMRHINADLSSEISTVFLMPPRDIAEVSSSMVKGMIGPDGWEDPVEKFVPSVVFEALKKRFKDEP